MIDTLMIFAAGRSTRMRHLTKDTPKGLLTILGKPILQYGLELAMTYPFKKIVINTHYLAQQINDFAEVFKKQRLEQGLDVPNITIIYEPELLETGGAVKNAYFSGALAGEDGITPETIFTMHSDVIIQTKENIFQLMESKWNGQTMDFLLMVQEFDKAIGYTGRGDFDVLEDGRLHHALEDNKNELHTYIEVAKVYSYMYNGVQIMRPNIVSRDGSDIFSLQKYYINNPRLYGAFAPVDCRWYHANTPEDITAIEEALLKY